MGRTLYIRIRCFRVNGYHFHGEFLHDFDVAEIFSDRYCGMGSNPKTTRSGLLLKRDLRI